MDEPTWLACTDSRDLLFALRQMVNLRSGTNARKLRLFACACCRAIWHLLPTPEGHQTVEVAERNADGLATRAEREAASRQFLASVKEVLHLEVQRRAIQAVARAAGQNPTYTFRLNTEDGPDARARWAAELAAYHAALAAGASVPEATACSDEVKEAARQEQVLLCRDVFGNPFRPVFVVPEWLSRRDGTIPKLAASAYDQRQLPSGHLDPALLAVLADALEEAGCQDEEILGHLRAPGPHIRGCWVVDRLTGRE